MNVLIRSKIVDEYLKLLCCKQDCTKCDYYDIDRDMCNEWINVEVIKDKLETVLREYLR